MTVFKRMFLSFVQRHVILLSLITKYNAALKLQVTPIEDDAIKSLNNKYC